MRSEDIIRAWKDESCREGLTEDQLTRLPAHPIGPVELQEEQLAEVGGAGPVSVLICPLTTIIVVTIVLDCFPDGEE